MSRCDNEGATHHTGCECHEARRDAEIERLKAEIASLQAQVEWLLEGREQQEQRLALGADE